MEDNTRTQEERGKQGTIHCCRRQRDILYGASMHKCQISPPEREMLGLVVVQAAELLRFRQRRVRRDQTGNGSHLLRHIQVSRHLFITRSAFTTSLQIGLCSFPNSLSKRFNVWNGSHRDNPLRIYLDSVRRVSNRSGPSTGGEKATYKGVRPKVVSLDMVKVRGVLERSILPIQLLHPPNPNSTPVYTKTQKPTDLLMFGYPWRISRMLHLKCLT